MNTKTRVIAIVEDKLCAGSRFPLGVLAEVSTLTPRSARLRSTQAVPSANTIDPCPLTAKTARFRGRDMLGLG